jgi:hypothetical protein
VNTSLSVSVIQSSTCFSSLFFFLTSRRRHFVLQKSAILAQCQQWLAEAQAATSQAATYTGLVHAHNPHLADRFKESPSAYCEAISAVVKQIEQTLQGLTMPESDEDDDEDDE